MGNSIQGAEQIGVEKQTLCKHQGDIDVNMEPVNAVFGSDCLQGDTEAADWEPSPANGVMMTGLLPAVPAFCGGAGRPC